MHLNYIINVSLFHLISSFAIIAKYKICHGLIRSFDLDLNVASPVAATTRAFKHSLEVNLLLYHFLVPVSPLVPEPLELSLLSVFLLLVTRKISHVGGDKLFWRYMLVYKSYQWLSISFIRQVEDDSSGFVIVCLSALIKFEHLIFEPQSKVNQVCPPLW